LNPFWNSIDPIRFREELRILEEDYMAWIKTIPPAEATGDLAEQYGRMKDAAGNVANILSIHSLNPAGLRSHFDLYKTLMFGRSDLSRAQREMIAVVVSKTNACHYWIRHHAEGLRKETRDTALVEAIVSDFRGAPISRAEHALLEFTEKLTREPSSCKEGDIQILRQAGWSDRTILDATLIISYFAFVNRIADGLGVELEEEMRKVL
jgi:uncharacterized peroxidase-related enzyme